MPPGRIRTHNLGHRRSLYRCATKNHSTMLRSYYLEVLLTFWYLGLFSIMNARLRCRLYFDPGTKVIFKFVFKLLNFKCNCSKIVRLASMIVFISQKIFCCGILIFSVSPIMNVIAWITVIGRSVHL